MTVRDDLAAAVPAWIVARVLVLGALALAMFAADDLGAASAAGRTQVDLLGWDASWYRDIAAEGYGGVAREALRFFPLLPLLGGLLGFLLAGEAGAGVLIVVNGAALAAGAVIRRLALEETGDDGTAWRTVWLLALAPSSFVLVMGYAEALLLASSVACFLLLRRRWWWAAAAAGLVAALSRPVGVALVLPAMIEAARGLSTAPPGDRVPRLAAVLGPVAGMNAYLAWVGFRFGDALLPLELQGQASRRGDFVNPLTRVTDAAREIASGEVLGSVLHLPWAVVFAGLLVVCFRRLPASYGAYAACLLVVAMSANNLDSLERYGLAAFPLVLSLALVTRPRWAELGVVTMSAGALVGYATLAFLGAYVP